MDEVADAVYVDDEGPPDRPAGRPRSRAITTQPPAEWRGEGVADRDRERVGGVIRGGNSSRPRIAFTIFADLLLVGPAVTADRLFDRAGAYSAHAMPADDAATSTAPRACPTESAMRASAPTYDSSRATASGRVLGDQLLDAHRRS